MRRILSLLLLLVAFNASAIDLEINSTFSGIWYNPNQSGHGLNVVVLDESTTIIFWYVYHTDGTPMFLITVGQNSGNHTTGTTYYNTGMKFGEFNPNDITETVWGTSTVTRTGCNSASLEYSSSVPGYGMGIIPMQRIAAVSGLKCSDSPLHGTYHISWVAGGKFGYGIATFFYNGEMVFGTESDSTGEVGIGQWWTNVDNTFGFQAYSYLTSGGKVFISGSGAYSEDDLTANYSDNGRLFATPVASFHHSLTTTEMAGAYNIYDWDNVYAGTATVQSDGKITAVTSLGCTINATFVVPDTNFNQARVSDAEISGCGDTLAVADFGAAEYRNETGEIFIAAADGFYGYVWTLKPK